MTLWRSGCFGLALACAGLAAPVAAADLPTFGPPAAWVKLVAIPPDAAEAAKTPTRALLSDQQYAFGADGAESIYLERAYRVQTAAGLQRGGTILIPWAPDVSNLTVHKIQIQRGGETIDLLKDGKDVQVLRRENNLERSILDGVLTATLPVEGLQVGDVVDYSFTEVIRQPVLKGHADAMIQAWPRSFSFMDTVLPQDPAPLTVHVSARWPRSRPFKWRAADLPGAVVVRNDGPDQEISLTSSKPEPYKIPTGAPLRFWIGPHLEISDYASWSDVSALFAPLYDQARKLAPDSPLRAEIAKIRAASSDPKLQAAAALTLVQDRIRYVAVAMNEGGLIPADADATWTRRWGDCKAKSSLLLALLDGLGIAAEPAAANATSGDGIDERLPMVAAFDHVLVRAQIAGKVYWLDGTRTGDRSLDAIEIPDFHWALPIRATGGKLEPLFPTPYDKPQTEIAVRIDASRGVQVSAPAHVEITYRGAAARRYRAQSETQSADDFDKTLRQRFFTVFNFTERGAASVATSSYKFDDSGDLHLVLDGQLPLFWLRRPGNVRARDIPDGKLTLSLPQARTGSSKDDAPFTVTFPDYSRWTETILLPKGRDDIAVVADPVDQTVGGRLVHRKVGIQDHVLTMEASVKALAPEITAADAKAATPVLKQIAASSVTLTAPEALFTEQNRQADVLAAEPKSADDYLARARVYLIRFQYAQALPDVSKAIDMGMKGSVPYGVQGEALQHLGKLDDARASFGKGLEAKPSADEQQRLKLSLAEVDLAANKPKDALDRLNAMLVETPHDGRALALRSRAYWGMGDIPKALTDSEAAVAADPGNMLLYSLRVSLFVQQKRPDKAVEVAQALIDANPGNGVDIAAGGEMLCNLRQQQACMDALGKAISLNPTGGAYIVRATFRPADDRSGKAADLDAAIKLEPTPRNLSAVATLQAANGDYAASAQTLLKAIALDDNFTLRSRLAAAYERSGQKELADKEYGELRAKADKDAMMLNNLCWDQATANVQLQRALADCNASIALKRGSPNLDSRGFVLLRLQRYDEAIAAYDASIALVSTQSDSFYGRGIARLRKGQTLIGQGDLASARARSPGIDRQFEGYGLTP